MSEVLVSVIIPVFNGERFLAQALGSVFAQDHRPLEVIVIDDGSTDASAAVARSFDEVILIQQGNGGPAAARNAGLSRATGSLFTFLDADDQMAPGRLTTQVEHLRTHPDIGCVIMKQELLLEPGMTVPSWVRPLGAPDDVVGGLMVTAMVRVEAAQLVGGFDPSYRVCEDVDWLFRLREAGVELEILPAVGVLRRIHRDNASHQVSAMRSALTRVVRERLERSRSGRSRGPSG